MLVVAGRRIVWVDFDVATTFNNMDSCEKVYCDYEMELVESFGSLLVCTTSLWSTNITVTAK